jgi:fluoride exporter
MWWPVALGAVVGSPCRFLIDALVSRRLGRAQPWGTLLINLSGSAILGMLAGLLARGTLTTSDYALLGVGFCGSFTTFSTFVWETIALVENRQVRTAVVNVVLSVAFGVAFAYGTFLLAAPAAAAHR